MRGEATPATPTSARPWQKPLSLFFSSPGANLGCGAAGTQDIRIRVLFGQADTLDPPGNHHHLRERGKGERAKSNATATACSGGVRGLKKEGRSALIGTRPCRRSSSRIDAGQPLGERLHRELQRPPSR
jgi:hypothetical protein